jgi:hypothetical protein
MGSVAQTWTAHLKEKQGVVGRGEIIVRAESLQESNHMINWQLTG